MDKKISVKVCLGTTCFVMGSANLQELIEVVPKKYGDKVIKMLSFVKVTLPLFAETLNFFI